MKKQALQLPATLEKRISNYLRVIKYKYNPNKIKFTSQEKQAHLGFFLSTYMSF
jgi:hypothetical protein